MPRLLEKDYRPIALAALVASLLLSLWSIYADDVINNDGIEYLRVAAKLHAGDWVNAVKFYKWPFYPLLIANVHSLTGLSFENAALAINAVMYVIIVLTFMALTLELGGDRKTLIASAITVLLFPALNDYRAFTIRDPGYLAFYLVSILFFIKQFRSPGFAVGFKSFAAIGVATLFRIEGLVFMLVTPILLALRRAESRPTRALVITIAVFALAVIIIGFGWWFFKPTREVGHMAILDNPFTVLANAWQQVSGDMEQKLTHIRTELLGRYSSGYSYAVMIFIVLTIIFTEVVTELGIIYLIFLIYTVRRKGLLKEKRIKTIWMMLLAINIAILFNFVLFRFFLAPRYSLALVLTLAIPIPFGVIALYDQWRERQKNLRRFNWKFPVAAMLFLISGIEGLGVFTEKGYIKEAGMWLRNNTPAEARVYTNDKILAYYSGRQATVDHYIDDPTKLIHALYDGWWKNQYLALRVKRKSDLTEAFITDYLDTKPIKRFTSEKGDSVIILKTKKE